MTLWRLEWLRLTRTRRLLVLLCAYAFFGLTGPLTARYLPQILDRLGTSGMQIEFPPPKPADGIAQFVSNASQICLLIVVMVAASALAFDARTEMAVFLRTRVGRVRASRNHSSRQMFMTSAPGRRPRGRAPPAPG